MEKDIKTIKKINVNIRDKEPYKTRIETFRNKLETTMPFWTKDAIDSFSGPYAAEDKKFLESMMTDRKASYGSVNEKLMKQTARTNERNVRFLKRLDQEKIMAEQRFGTAELSDDDSNENQSLAVHQPVSVPSDGASSSASTSEESPSKRRRSERVLLDLPQKWYNDPTLVAIAVRGKMSSTYLNAYLNRMAGVSCYLFHQNILLFYSFIE